LALAIVVALEPAPPVLWAPEEAPGRRSVTVRAVQHSFVMTKKKRKEKAITSTEPIKVPDLETGADVKGRFTVSLDQNIVSPRDRRSSISPGVPQSTIRPRAPRTGPPTYPGECDASPRRDCSCSRRVRGPPIACSPFRSIPARAAP